MRRRRLGSLILVVAAGGAATGLLSRGAAADLPKCPSCPSPTTLPPVPGIGHGGTPLPHIRLPPGAVHPGPLTLPIPLTVNGCATTAVVLDLPIPAGGARQIPFTANVGDGVTVSFDPQTPYVQGGDTTVSTTMYVTYRSGSGGGADVPVTVNAAGAHARFSVHRAPMIVTDVSPRTVRTPRFMHPGDAITITGTGLCAAATYRFANGVAPLTREQNGDGTRVTLTAPYDAASGSITIDYVDLHAVTPALTMDDIRRSWGFAFSNSDMFQAAVGGYDTGDLQGDFGDAAPYNVVAAAAVLGIADGSLTHGNCFGFSTLAGRSAMGTHGTYPSWGGSNPSLATPLPVTAEDTWHVFGPVLSGGGDIVRQQTIARDIHRGQLMQLSDEVLAAALTATNLSGDPATFRDSLAREFGGSRPAIISIANSCNHAILAYDLHDDGRGNTLVSTYDPNVPYDVNEGTDASLHAQRVGFSTFTFSVDHTFSYNDGPNNGAACSGSLSDVRVLTLGSIPMPGKGTMPGDIGDAIVHLVGGASIAQVTDGQGHTLLRPDGSLNVDPATRIANGAPLSLMGGARGDRLFFFRRPGALTYSVRGNAAQPYIARYVMPGMVVELENVPTSPGAVDSVSVDPAGGIDVRGASGKPFTAKLTVRTPGGYRSVVVHGALGAGGATHVAFDAARDTIVYRHAGAKTPVRFELGDATGAKIATKSLDVGAGDSITVRPGWSALASGAGSMVHQSAAGAIATHPLR